MAAICQTNDTSVKEIKRKMKKSKQIVRAWAESMRDNTFQCARAVSYFSMCLTKPIESLLLLMRNCENKCIINMPLFFILFIGYLKNGNTQLFFSS